jgi:hypothetical protein
MKTQKESEKEKNPPAPPAEQLDLRSEFEPKSLTPLQNIILTAKVFGAIALLILVVWLMQRAKG